MARLAKFPAEPDTVIGLKERFNVIRLIRGGRRAYLHVKIEHPKVQAAILTTFSGPAALRALAKAILEEVGDE